MYKYIQMQSLSFTKQFLSLALEEMGLLHKFLATVAVVLLLGIHPHTACRILEDKEEIWKKRGGGLVLESLQKGSDQSSGPSGCTNVPNNPGPNCPVKEMNFAGDASARASANPHPNVHFGVVSNG